MGTTSNLDLPYPESTDLVIEGDDSMQALAEAVEATLMPAWCSGYDLTPQAIGSGVTVSLPILAGSGHFTSPGAGFIEYTGPQRLFLVSVTTEIGTGPGIGRQTTDLYANASVAGRTNELPTDAGFDATHTLSAALVLVTGDTIHVDAHATSGDGTVESTRFHIVSVGPAGAI